MVDDFGEQRKLLIDFVELFMAITRRMADPVHTDLSIGTCIRLYRAWLQSVQNFIRKHGLKRDSEKWCTPKLHAMYHMIMKIAERGTMDYHSCNA